METSLYHLFAVPFVHLKHPQAERLNPLLREHILSLEADGAMRNPSPAMGIPAELFESTFDFFRSNATPVVALREFCFGALKQTVAELGQLPAAEVAGWTLNSHTWFHVSRSGAYFASHNHPMASWSGVYCVDPGDGEGPENGAISFQNPLGLSNMFMDRANVRMRLPFSSKNFLLKYESGDLVLFPSYLIHQVLPYRGTRPRITVAFNCWFPA
jgi:hypothetical protein